MSDRARFTAAILLAMAGLLGACASRPTGDAGGGGPLIRRASVDPARLELAPLDYTRFCMSHRTECELGVPDAVIGMTPEVEAEIHRVNRDVNQRIRPVKQTFDWRIDPESGNCNDYVVSKRHALMASGLPASALLIAVVTTPAGEGHLVLIARTDRGDLVLDNLTPEIRRRGETAYLWIKRQSPSHAVLWERM
ncbi:transglutaminase-like cysteine peptidase [Bosea sp. 124]|uniref:transglutaminase-like cysteine peptidase n=1 Tax=Bosea sp. 124 TaxID=2135642 RepID=UPI000D3AF0BD|nr:transglutaminase-like cysteine peptidase [Bosea sp. 124]PTM42976.1 putative transglutaminase-like cysteine proteinase [Bosea sp. 124]